MRRRKVAREAGLFLGADEAVQVRNNVQTFRRTPAAVHVLHAIEAQRAPPAAGAVWFARCARLEMGDV